MLSWIYWPTLISFLPPHDILKSLLQSSSSAFGDLPQEKTNRQNLPLTLQASLVTAFRYLISMSRDRTENCQVYGPLLPYRTYNFWSACFCPSDANYIAGSSIHRNSHALYLKIKWTLKVACSFHKSSQPNGNNKLEFFTGCFF